MPKKKELPIGMVNDLENIKYSKDIKVGMQVGRWIVIEEFKGCSHGKTAKVKVRCTCGSNIEKEVSVANLKNNCSLSCGCYCIEQGHTGDATRKRSEASKKLHPHGCFKGHKHTEESKRKISDATKGEKNPFYGKKHTEETKTKMRDLSLTEEDRQYKRCQNGYYEWRLEVKRQANYTCDCCGQHDVKLCSHHLNNYKDNPNKRTDINNGVCLCEKCHKEFHGYMGGYKVPCTKEDYIKFKEERNSEDVLVASF